MNQSARVSTGWSELDSLLGGGLLPGTMTVLLGATGIGKTQFGISFAHQGLESDGRCGVVLDLAARGDSQNHQPYAQRMRNWDLPAATQVPPIGPNFFQECKQLGAYWKALDRIGHRVVLDPSDTDAKDAWQREINRRTQDTLAFLYGSLLAGTRRVVIDGIEPAGRPEDSVQVELIEYLDHQLLHKDCEWVARDVFRQHFRTLESQVLQHRYDQKSLSCLALCTSHETMLDALIEKPLADSDLLANANTLIYLGKIRDGHRMKRALYIAKHRGSACDEQIHFYEIDDQGLKLAAS